MQHDRIQQGRKAYRFMQPVILGLLLGALVGFVNFGLLVRMSSKIIDMEAKRAGIVVMLGYLLRIILYAVAVFAAVFFQGIDALATGAGIIAMGLIYTIRVTLQARRK